MGTLLHFVRERHALPKLFWGGLVNGVPVCSACCSSACCKELVVIVIYVYYYQLMRVQLDLQEQTIYTQKFERKTGCTEHKT